jgi:hypothetical protein
MTNHPNRAGKFELEFWGGTKIRYRKHHTTFEAAKATAHRVFAAMPDIGEQRAAHPAIIYGPDCGRDGVTVS